MQTVEINDGKVFKIKHETFVSFSPWRLANSQGDIF